MHPVVFEQIPSAQVFSAAQACDLEMLHALCQALTQEKHLLGLGTGSSDAGMKPQISIHFQVY